MPYQQQHTRPACRCCRGSTAKHKGRAAPVFTFVEGRCEVTLTLDLKEGTLKLSHGGRTLGTIAGVKGPLHAAVTITSSRQMVSAPPPWCLIISTHLYAQGCCIVAAYVAGLTPPAYVSVQQQVTLCTCSSVR